VPLKWGLLREVGAVVASTASTRASLPRTWLGARSAPFPPTRAASRGEPWQEAGAFFAGAPGRAGLLSGVLLSHWRRADQAADKTESAPNLPSRQRAAL
jgi:hypothetical protein